MPVFDHPEFDQHEMLHFVHEPKTGLKAIIAIHSTALGPAAGGCRRWQYTSNHAALTDALRLSRGMTYKNAVAGLNFGGGKSVILPTHHRQRHPSCFVHSAVPSKDLAADTSLLKMLASALTTCATSAKKRLMYPGYRKAAMRQAVIHRR